MKRNAALDTSVAGLNGEQIFLDMYNNSNKYTTVFDIINKNIIYRKNDTSTVELYLNFDSSSTAAMTVGSTWQIPANVWQHNLILLRASRYGRFDSQLLRKDWITSGEYANKTAASEGVTLFAMKTEGEVRVWSFSISTTGLIKFFSKSTSSDADPNVGVIGIL